MSKSHYEAYVIGPTNAFLGPNEVRAWEGERLLQYKLRRVCPACDRIVPLPDFGGFPECCCGYRDDLLGNYVPTWFERSPISRRWWQVWKPVLIDGMTWGPWVRSKRKYQMSPPPPPPKKG